MTIQALSRVVEAYTKRAYAGNLMDLFPTMSKYEYIVQPRLLHLAHHFLHASKVNPVHTARAVRRLLALRRHQSFFDSFGMHIDNGKLEGFINRFETSPCSATTCEDCGYCDQWRHRTVRLLHDDRDRQRAIEAVADLLETLCDGAL
jgi:hypothetical protein